MDYLKNKSEINQEAAAVLHKNNLYPSVIHCSYYSCLQLMKHIYHSVFGKTESELSIACNTSYDGSHGVIINSVVDYFKTNNKDWRSLNTKMVQLKKMRVAADYGNTQVDSAISSNSITLSADVLSLLNKNIKV